LESKVAEMEKAGDLNKSDATVSRSMSLKKKLSMKVEISPEELAMKEKCDNEDA
jgi:hypothetical protein